MIVRKLIKFWFIFVLFLAAGIASAHQPDFVSSKTRLAVREPEISKAYYGFLPNQPVMYVISSSAPFRLYVSLLVPDLPEISKDISATVVYQDGSIVARLNGQESDWVRWHEKFAGDEYWQGPEFQKDVAGGTYTVIVSSPDNNWDKYVLAIGERESFSLISWPETEKEIMTIKTQFFDKARYSIFEGRIGIVLVGILAVIAILVFRPWQYIKRAG